MEKKIIELEKGNGIVEKIDVHYRFSMLKNCFSLPKLLYFQRTSTCFNHPALLENYDKTVCDGLSKVCNVNFDDISSTQLALLAEMGGLGVSSASILALPACLFNAHQGKFGSQWLNVVPCKNLGLKLDYQQLRISIGLRLEANICVAHTCHRGEKVERDGLHGLSCTKSAGRFSRHATLNSLKKQTLGSLDLPSMLEPRGLYRTDSKRPVGVTMIPWKMGEQLGWVVTVVDALAPSRLNQGSLCNPGTTATEAEARKIEKYRELIDNGYIFN